MRILSRAKGNAEEYARWSVNPVLGCTHQCSYCYLRKGAWSENLGGCAQHLKKGIKNEAHAFYVAMSEIIENRDQIVRDGGLFMSFVTDPLHSVFRYLFLEIAYHATTHYGIPVTILSKSVVNNSEESLSRQYFKLAASSECTSLLAFGATLTGHDEMEPFAPTNRQRVIQLQRHKEFGFHTWASIEPVIDFDSSFKMINQAMEAGVEHLKIGLLTRATKVVRGNYLILDCAEFIEKVANATKHSGVTVYWKQSVYDLLRGTKNGKGLEEQQITELFNQPHFVGKEWSMFSG